MASKGNGNRNGRKKATKKICRRRVFKPSYKTGIKLWPTLQKLALEQAANQGDDDMSLEQYLELEADSVSEGFGARDQEFDNAVPFWCQILRIDSDDETKIRSMLNCGKEIQDHVIFNLAIAAMKADPRLHGATSRFPGAGGNNEERE